MPLALIVNAVLAVLLTAVILTLLLSAIRRSHAEQRLELARARRLRPNDHRSHARARAHGAARRGAGWVPSPDAS